MVNPGKMIARDDPSYDYRSGKTYLFRRSGWADPQRFAWSHFLRKPEVRFSGKCSGQVSRAMASWIFCRKAVRAASLATFI
jgi:hypothetical protein